MREKQLEGLTGLATGAGVCGGSFCDPRAAGRSSASEELRDQIKDATDSVVSNIAEGFEQSTDRGFARYLYISKGSTAEVRTRLALALERKLHFREEQSRADRPTRGRGRPT